MPSSVILMNNIRIMQFKAYLLVLLLIPMLNSCFTSMHHSQQPALVKNADIDETLKITKDEIKKENISQSLGLWVLRDQVITPSQAKTISDLYLNHIDSMKVGFNIWHASWAIANLYRLGDVAVKAELEQAYQKAKIQPARIEKKGQKKIAESHINGNKIVTGFIHAGGRSYAKRHLVVPGNKKYIQSYEEYLKKEKR
ncbi:MAG: hypothetical protein K0R26_2780 [Bacteroidota bacterium]|jgi:hypothetical protein|nr:hypothetical protein [Bacteroidota bacterium]